MAVIETDSSDNEISNLCNGTRLSEVYGLTVVAMCFPESSRALAIALVIAGNIGGELLGSFAGGSSCFLLRFFGLWQSYRGGCS